MDIKKGDKVTFKRSSTLANSPHSSKGTVTACLKGRARTVGARHGFLNGVRTGR